MKRLLIPLILLAITTTCLPAITIIPYSEISTAELNRSIIPDMAGNVLIKDSDLGLFLRDPGSRPLPEVYPGFPVSYTNSNTLNGAIYLNMDEDPDLEIVYGVGTRIVALKLDGTPVPGWPVTLSFYVWGSPAAGDITGDGIPEIVVTSRNSTNGNTGALYAYHLDGTPVDGFPVTQAGGGTMNACLADITGDGIMEILVNVRNHPNGWVYVFDGSGSVVEGWPQTLDTFPGAGISSGDITGDGNNEVIALSYQSLFVYDNQGNLLDGFPVTMPGITYSYSSPVLVDLDNSGQMQIIYGGCSDAGGAVFVVNPDGTFREGWPQYTDSWIFASASIADLNSDGELDIIIGDQVSSEDPANYIYAWDKDGNVINGFPAGPTNAIYTQIGIVDITGNDYVNLIISSNLFAFGYDAYNHDGTHTEGWPLPCGTDWSAVTMQSTPVFGDFNNNGYLDMAGASTGFLTWLVELYVWSTSIPYNDELAYMIIDGCDIQHSGVFVRPGTVMEQVATPAFSPEPGQYEVVIPVEITCETEDAEIYYTLDESEPTQGSLLYTGEIILENSTTIKARAYKDGWLPSEIAEGTYDIVTSADELAEALFIPLRAYPNPFNPETTIEFSLTSNGIITLEIFDIRGRKVRTLVNEKLGRGYHKVVWDGRNDAGRELASGLYLYRLSEGRSSQTNRMLLIK